MMRKKVYTDDELRESVTISEHQLPFSNGKIGKIAIFKTTHWQPTDILNFAIDRYVGDALYNEFIDINCNDPWTRVVISDFINDDCSDWITLESFLRDRKINKVLDIPENN